MIAKMQRKANSTYTTVVAGLLAGILTYLGILWIASVQDIQGLAVGAMWFFGIIVFPIVYLQPTSVAILSIFEALNWRDEAKRWDTIRVGVLLFICIMSAGGLAMLLAMMGAGRNFPAVIPLLLFIIATQLYAGKVNAEKWMKILAALATFILAVSTLKVMPFEEWSQGVYEGTGYSVDVGPSKDEVTGRKTLVKNKRLAQAGAAQCILEWEKAHMSGGHVVSEDKLTEAIAWCQKRFMPTSKRPAEFKMLQPSTWWAWTKEHPIYAAILAIIHLWVGWKLIDKWVKRGISTSATATTTVATASKTATPGFIERNKGKLLLAALIGGGGYFGQDYYMPFIRQVQMTPADEAARANRQPQKSATPQVARFPQFLNPDTTGKWRAEIAPGSNPGMWLFGNKSFEIYFGEHIGQRLEGGQLPYVIDLDVEKLILDVKGTSCGQVVSGPDADGWARCTGNFRTGSGTNGGSYALTWNVEERYITFYPSKGGEVWIKLVRV